MNTIPNLSEEQASVVDSLITGVLNRRRQQTLGGFAGTGKTTTIRTLKARLPGFAVAAFTGKAANMLRRKGIVDASTIHSAIYVPVRDDYGDVEFRLRPSMEPGVAGFIIDESSMVSRAIYHDLMSFGLPTIFVGDHGQLEPVNSDFNLMAKPDYTLEKIHRNSGEIPRFAEHVRLGRDAKDFRPTSDAVVLLRKGNVDDDLVRMADQVIVAFNNSRVNVNKYIRGMTGRQGILEPGERVMCLRNSHAIGLFNGMQGRVTQAAWKEGIPTIDFATYDGDHQGLRLDPNQFGKEGGADRGLSMGLHPFDYCYAITCHKAQGDEWPVVLVLEQRCSKWDHKRWAYTAASRAQEKLLWIVGSSR